MSSFIAIDKMQSGDSPALATVVKELCDADDTSFCLTFAHSLRSALLYFTESRCSAAYDQGDREAMRDLQLALSAIYDQQFQIPRTHPALPDASSVLSDIQCVIERRLLDAELSHLSPGHNAQSDPSPKRFRETLNDLIESHPATRHAFFGHYLPEIASIEDLRYFCVQESTLDPRFDDLLALLQVGTSGEVKLELARNYYDEMGNGDPLQVHSSLFARAIQELGVTLAPDKSDLMTEALICGNLSACLALNRRFFHLAIGYFGITEQLAVRRFQAFLKAWERHGLSDAGSEYHRVHITIDVGHADGWWERVATPLVLQAPDLAPVIITGVFLRLETSRLYLDALLDHLLRGHGIATE